MTIPEKAVEWALKTAADNSHGYSQADRWGPDYDCSSFVIEAYEQAGLKLRAAGASYTGNMRSAFLKSGFVDVTLQCGLSTGYGIQPGDVLLNYAAHTCLAVGNGKVANCRTDEGNPQHGDQSGNEIRVQSYWNYPWNAILRYKVKTAQPEVETMPEGDFESGSYLDALASLVPNSGTSGNTETAKPKEDVSDPTEDHHWKPGTLKRSSKYSVNNVILQGLLTARGFNCGSIDGYFGPLTEIAVNHARRYYGMERNGECDYALWIKLLLIERGE
jgi:peptidoglycan hydrolase-like protein with peptidoglycan-binding domain